MNIGFRLCFTQSSVVCPSIFISSMPSVKVRFERSKQHEERGSIITVYITATTAGSSFRHVFCCRLRLGMLRIGAFLSMFREGMRPRLVFDMM